MKTARPLTLATALLILAFAAAASAPGCNAEGVPDEPNLLPSATTAEVAPRGFSWLVDDKLAGMAYPGTGEQADKTLDYLAGAHITRLVSLTEEAPVPDKVKTAGIEQVHIPVKDFTAPSIEQLETFVTDTRSHLSEGGRVTVHCAGGKGRTGTFLSAWLISEDGLSAAAAMAQVRELRPGSIETASQEQILAEFEAKLRPPEAGAVTP